MFNSIIWKFNSIIWKFNSIIWNLETVIYLATSNIAVIYFNDIVKTNTLIVFEAGQIKTRLFDQILYSQKKLFQIFIRIYFDIIGYLPDRIAKQRLDCMTG